MTYLIQCNNGGETGSDLAVVLVVAVIYYSIL